MKVGDKFTREVYTGNTAAITILSVEEDGYRYAIEFEDGRKGVGFKRWSDPDALKKDDVIA